jgi:hypothetical protein
VFSAWERRYLDAAGAERLVSIGRSVLAVYQAGRMVWHGCAALAQVSGSPSQCFLLPLVFSLRQWPRCRVREQTSGATGAAGQANAWDVASRGGVKMTRHVASSDMSGDMSERQHGVAGGLRRPHDTAFLDVRGRRGVARTGRLGGLPRGREAGGRHRDWPVVWRPQERHRPAGAGVRVPHSVRARRRACARAR